MYATVSKTGYGVDVSLDRQDELEKRLCKVVAASPGCRVLDLGCGAGGAAARLAAAQADTTGVDIHDFAAEWSRCASERFVHGDIRHIATLLPQEHFTHCLCNRTLHYLPYADARMTLTQLRSMVSDSLFISFSGLTSALARSYEVRENQVHTRFGYLSPDDQAVFGITQPLTLYTESEAIILLSEAGWRVTWSRTTDFGNVLCVAS